MHDGTVLTVDDKANIRELVCRQLRHGGLQAESAGTAAEALERISRADISLVIVDVALDHPKGGLELADKIHGMDPELPILFLTGYPGSTSEYSYIEVITKPHTERELVLKVRAELLKHCTNRRVKLTYDMMKAHVEDKALHSPGITEILMRDIAHPAVRALLTVVGTLLVVLGGVGLAALRGYMK